MVTSSDPLLRSYVPTTSPRLLATVVIRFLDPDGVDTSNRMELVAVSTMVVLRVLLWRNVKLILIVANLWEVVVRSVSTRSTYIDNDANFTQLV